MHDSPLVVMLYAESSVIDNRGIPNYDQHRLPFLTARAARRWMERERVKGISVRRYALWRGRSLLEAGSDRA